MRRNMLQSSVIYTALTYGAVILTVMALGWYGYSRYTPIPEAEQQKPAGEILPNDWVKGESSAPVKIIEYSDFQCPACRLYSQVVNDLIKVYPTQIGIAYRHFPLKTLHLQATLAAQAAEAAGKQGKFWEMHDLLFEKQAEWAEKRNAKELFVGYAKTLGLHEAEFIKALESKEVRALVEADYRSGIPLRINSTPTFFLNGERLANPQGLEPFKQIINEKLQAATASGQPS